MNRSDYNNVIIEKINSYLKNILILIQIFYLKLKIFKITLFFSDILLKLIYTTKFGTWLENNKPSFNDFPTLNCKWQNRYNLYEYILKKENLISKKISYLEFGVFKGDSIKWWLNNNNNKNSEFFGFDTFEGLPVAWGDQAKGTFNTTLRTPDVHDDRCNFVVGLFQNTLKNFIKKFNRNDFCIFHLDADLYSSTFYVLINIIEILKEGDIILFDEFNNYYIDNEFKAFCDFLEIYNLKYEIIGAVNNYSKIAIKVKCII